jgi:Na+-driven multidrug efflux pump/anti-sigma regulatory factor (Ser/Thr protein kinase)
MTNAYLIRKVFTANLFPSIIAGLAVTIGLVIDGILTGNLIGPQGLAVIGISTPLFLFFAGIAGVLREGGVACCAEYIGRGEPGKVNANFTAVVSATVMAGLILTVFGVVFTDALAMLLGARGELLSMFKEYTLGISLGAVPIMLSQVLYFYVQLDGSPTLCIVSAASGILVNAVLDVVMVLVLHLGMLGIALATTISYTVILLMLCLHFAGKSSSLKLRFTKGLSRELARTTAIGFPTALEMWSYTLRVGILNRLLFGIAGAAAVTAFAIQYDIDSFVSSITIGVGMNTLMLTGIFYGEEDIRSLKDTLGTSLRLGLLLSIAAAALVFIFAPQLAAAFGETDAASIAMTVRAIRFFSAGFPLSLISTVLINYYQGIKNIGASNLICVGENLFFILLFSYALAPLWGTDGIWASFFLGEAGILVTAALLIRVKKKKRLRSLEDFMLLPESILPEADDHLDISIGNDINEVISLSLDVAGFCRKHNIDKRTSFFFPLCVEEMAGNVVSHAFKPGENKFIDIRIIKKGSSLIFCMRDDGAQFNPFKHLASMPEDDRLSNVGIRLVQKLATEVDYRYAVGLNNLLILFGIK